MRPDGSRVRLGLWLVSGLIFLAAFLWTASRPESRVNNDSAEYLKAGENLWLFGTYYAGNLNQPRDFRLYSRRPPLYSILAAPLFGERGDLLVLVQTALTFLSAWWMLSLLGSAGCGEGVRLLAIALFLLTPAQWIYSNLVMAEILLQFLLVLAGYALSRFLRERRLLWLVVLNGALALGVLTKPILMYVWIPGLAFHFWLLTRLRRRILLPALLVSLLPAAAVSGWSLRNREVTGYFHFTSQKTDQMRLLSAQIREPVSERNSFETASRSAEEAYYRRMLEDWPRTLQVHLRGAALLYLDPGRFDFYEFLDWEHPVSGTRELFRTNSLAGYAKSVPFPLALVLAGLLLLNLLVTAALVWWALKVPVPTELKVFVVGLIAYLTVMTGPIGTSRYRLALAPFLALAAAPVFVSAGTRVARYLKEGRRSRERSGSAR